MHNYGASRTFRRESDTVMVVESRTREIENIRSWSCANNLNFNLKKSSEIVFVDSMRRRQIQLPSLLEGIPRVCSLNILGITINKPFSVSEHVSCVIGKCAQTIQALRIFRSHGLCNDALCTDPLLLANSFMQ